VFVNTTRDATCTDERIDAELALLEWFPIWGDAFFQYLDENMGDPEGFPGQFPPEEPPGVGPCADTLGMEQAFATGTGMARQNDNDLFGSGTRGNSFRNHLVASLRTADGNKFQYHSRFHVNSRCHCGESEPPACRLEWTKLG
jgi:hypothetical protein